jgi:hypothetical protein
LYQIITTMQPWKDQSIFTKFLFVGHGRGLSYHSPDLNAHLSPSSAFIDHPTSLALLAQALRSVELLSSLVKPGTRLLSATSDLQGDIFEVQQVLGSSATAHQRFLILNPIRQKSLLFPLFEYPSLLSDYCRRSKDSELYPLLYLAHLYAVGIIVELSMPEVEFPTLARGLMVPLESTYRAIASQPPKCEGGNLAGVVSWWGFRFLWQMSFGRRERGL